MSLANSGKKQTTNLFLAVVLILAGLALNSLVLFGIFFICEKAQDFTLLILMVILQSIGFCAYMEKVIRVSTSIGDRK